MANCLYFNLDTDEYWIMDWRIYDPDGDGKKKLDHVRDMFDDAIANKNLPFSIIVMDSWYATKALIMHIGKAGKLFYCPIKSNLKLDYSPGQKPYKQVVDLEWFGDEILRGKIVKIHEFPQDYKVKLFRGAATKRTEYVVTNDVSVNSATTVKDMRSMRWKIEQYYRESKQMLGIA